VTATSPEVMADRFGLPVEWTQMHVGEHRCVDGRMYRFSCLVSDPSCEAAARSYMRLAAEKAARFAESDGEA
jgi:hypothetical protein